MRRAGIIAGCVLILLGMVLTAAFAGIILALGMAVVAATALVLALLLPRRGWVNYVALSLALLGSAIGVIGAIQAFVAVGNSPGYDVRVPMGAAALVLALVAGGAGVMAWRHPGAGAALLVLAGVAGVVAINLYYINTAYDLALPCWLLSALLYLAGNLRPGKPASPGQRSRARSASAPRPPP